jgi:hypothetical protein
MENYFHQEIVVFEDDTIVIKFPLEVIEFNNVYNVGSYDNVWFGISSTPGGTYIQQYANANWDQGILNGPAYNFITQNFTGGTEDNYNVSPTSVNPVGGVGAILTTQVNALGVINSAIFSFTDGGTNYQAGDVLTFAASLFGTADQDLEVTLDSSFFPLLPEPNTNEGVIEIDAPEGPNGPATARIEIRQDSFQASGGPLVTGNTYYWELVVGEYTSYSITNFNSQTQVSAAGTLYISGSMFSKQLLRPII